MGVSFLYPTWTKAYGSNHFSGEAAPLQDFDTIPFADRDLIDNNAYLLEGNLR